MSGSDLTAARHVLMDSPETWHMIVTIAGQLKRSLWGKMAANEQLLRLAAELLPGCAQSYDAARSTAFIAYVRPRIRAGIVKRLRPLYVDRQTRALMIAVYGGHAARRLFLEQYDPAPPMVAQREQRLTALDNAVSQLPTDYRDIVRGHYYDGKSIAILASSLGCAPESVSSSKASPSTQRAGIVPQPSGWALFAKRIGRGLSRKTPRGT